MCICSTFLAPANSRFPRMCCVRVGPFRDLPTSNSDMSIRAPDKPLPPYPKLVDANLIIDGGLTEEEARRVQIDGRIAALEREILDLKAERNSISPIARLPPEILSRIFVAFANLCPKPGSVYSRPLGPRPQGQRTRVALTRRTIQWSVLTEISQQWRNVALACPQLWSHVAFHKPGWAQLMLQRSKQAPLYINFEEPMLSETYRYAAQALSQVHRLKYLMIRGQTEWVKDRLRELTSPAPMLERLELAARPGYRSEDLLLPDNFLAGDAPKLRIVSLDGWQLNSWETPLLEGLTSLRLSSSEIWAPSAPSASLFMDVLEKMPQLAELDLEEVFPDLDTASESRVVPLIRLKALTLKASLQQIVSFLAHTIIAPSATIALRCLANFNDDVVVFTRLANALRSSWLSSPAFPPSTSSSHLGCTAPSTCPFKTLTLHRNSSNIFELFCYSKTINFSLGLGEVRTLSLEVNGNTKGVFEGILKGLPLSGLRALNLGCQIEDTELDHLSSLPDIESVYLDERSAARFIQCLKDDHVARPENASGIETQQEGVSCFRSLRYIYLADPDFDHASNIDSVDLDDLLDMLMIRYELGGEIETLKITDALNLDEHSVGRIGEVCADVDWDGRVEMTSETEDESESDYYF
ncbi:hypothetical protein BKA70DRAFT_475518 [Coprinopsis sp. MPI-PUGE-AT-0042]|nr:hypothetical protein BKA70DRAFT_475518 [Coprinopsis sp. MPI-PUGE-AT-0042]